jgi:hypothetical protein
VKNPGIMSNFKFLYKLFAGFFLISILMSCESRFPSVNTIDVINITANSAQSGGIVSDEGSGTVIARGLVWSMNYVPTLESHDGTPITNVTDKSTWTAPDSPAFCWYNNLIENKNLAGAHYKRA